MRCSRCGKPLPAGRSSCTTCDSPAIASAAAPAATRPRAGAPPGSSATAAGGARGAYPETSGEAEYAGFWLRLLADCIDSLVFAVPVVIAAAIFIGVAPGGRPRTGASVALPVVASVVFHVALWLYYAVSESSGWQATPGKRVLGLLVTDTGGRSIGFGRATGRYFGRFLSNVTLGVGFVLAGFTARKQALHDLVAGTLVVRRRDESRRAAFVAGLAAGAFGGTLVIGVLAAVVIPGVLRLQLRAKSAEAPELVASLAAAEVAYLEKYGRFTPLGVPSQHRPGKLKMPWNARDRDVAAAVGWDVEGTSYFTYRAAVGTGVDGGRTLSICAESDLDGDGKSAAVVLWLPSVDQWGHPVTAPPRAPCAFAPAAERPLEFGRDDPIGEPIRVTPEDVF